MSPCLKNSSMHLESSDVTACDGGANVHLPGGPLVVQVPGLGRVWHVTRVQQQREDTWLVKARGGLISRKEAFHLLQLAEVHWHVWTVDTISFIHLQHRANLVSPLCANSLFLFGNWPNRYMLSENTCSDVFCWVKNPGDCFWSTIVYRLAVCLLPVCRTISMTRLRHSLKSVLDMLLRMLQSLSIIVLGKKCY